jgi:GT2 family glycosyltransferase
MLGKNPTISLIFVNYRSSAYLKKALESISNSENKDTVEILIVNNDVREKELVASLGVVYGARVIETGNNIGFGSAANTGALEAKGRLLGFLNPDIEWPGKQLEKIQERLKEDIIIGFGLFDENNNREKYGFGKRVHLLRLIQNHLFSHQQQVQNRKQVDWVSGGALFCSKDIFEKVGGFDEGYFLYYEDVDFCERARITGYPSFVYQDLRVTHFRGKSHESPKEQKKQYYASQKYYFQKMRPKYEQQLLRLFHFFLT